MKSEFQALVNEIKSMTEIINILKEDLHHQTTTSHERKLNSTCTTKNPTRTSTDCCKLLDLEIQLKEILREQSSVKLISEILNKENQALNQTSHNDASTNSTWMNARSRGPRGTAFNQPLKTAFDQQPKIAPTTQVASQYQLPTANRYDALSSCYKLWEHSDPMSTTKFEQRTKPMPGHTNEHTKELRRKKAPAVNQHKRPVIHQRNKHNLHELSINEDAILHTNHCER